MNTMHKHWTTGALLLALAAAAFAPRTAQAQGLPPHVQQAILETQILDAIAAENHAQFLDLLKRYRALGGEDLVEVLYYEALALEATGKPQEALKALARYLTEMTPRHPGYDAETFQEAVRLYPRLEAVAKDQADRPNEEFRVLRGHEGAVTSVSWSPDGQRVVSGSEDDKMRIWNVGRGRIEWRGEHRKPVHATAWSPDGRYIATGSGDSADLWDARLRRRKWLRQLAGGEWWTTRSVAWSSDGRFVATGGNAIPSRDRLYPLSIFDVEADNRVRAIYGIHQRGVSPGRRPRGAPFLIRAEFNQITFSPDGLRVAAIYNWRRRHPPDVGGRDGSFSSGTHLRVWNARTGSEVYTVETGEVSSVAWNPGGEVLAVGVVPNTVAILNAFDGRRLRDLDHFHSGVRSLAFSPDGRYLATGAEDGAIRLWDTGTWGLVVELPGHNAAVQALDWSADGRALASGSKDQTVRIWGPPGGLELLNVSGKVASFDTFRGRGTLSVAFSPDGQRLAVGLSGGGEDMVRILEAETGQVLHRLAGHSSYVAAVAYSPDGQYLASGSRDGTIRIYRAVSGDFVRAFTRHRDLKRGDEGYQGVTDVAWGADSRRMVSSSLDGSLMIWDVPEGELVQDIPLGDEKSHHTESFLHSVDWSLDAQYLAAGGNGPLRIIEAATGEVLRVLPGGERARVVRFSPDGRRLAAGLEPPLHIPFDEAPQPFNVAVWDVQTGERIRNLPGLGLRSFEGEQLRGYNLQALEWSPDGRFLAAGAGWWVDAGAGAHGNAILVWNGETGELLREIEGVHWHIIRDLAWHPEGDRFATGSSDATVKVWSLGAD